MTAKEVVKSVMKSRHFTYVTIAEKLGYQRGSNVSNMVNRGNMTIDTLLKILDTMGCELVVKSKLSDKQAWVVDNKPEIKTVSDKEEEELKGA